MHQSAGQAHTRVWWGKRLWPVPGTIRWSRLQGKGRALESRREQAGKGQELAIQSVRGALPSAAGSEEALQPSGSALRQQPG